ncbi:unnamed protein product [Rotaria sordida]|uniref:FLYWCH-type domain-containing protein n=1 Tax=Rotaria sordida TaxID=392033 RepID=A0A819H2M8_9BILA|nr:unnamed protein product [Rotaria sordida]CAF1097775.1 unnamed protein product [Rotaria sordida]CAF1297772.1 unnamed protein product [Rotaria sordida]CAF3891213.1 unnamed protein product [Rotaria sordida]CAF3902423.1 unnamed protein product [Rotaria sordida]
MPITTRAAALRSQANGDLNHSQGQATSTPTSTVKTTHFQPTSSSSILVESTSPYVPISSTTTETNNHSITSLGSSNNDENEVFSDESNDLMNKPIVKGEITIGTSTRGGKMILMNRFSYLYMSTAKETTGWRCARRNEKCKAVIHVPKQTGQFSH